MVAACFIFLIYTIWKLVSKEGFDLSLIKHPSATVGYGLAAAAVFAAIVYISSAAWKQILEFLGGRKFFYAEIRNVYVRSNIAKYLPGNVMHFAGRNVLGKKFGFSQFDMALSTVIEVISLLFTACVWSLAFAYRSFVQAIVKSVNRSPWVVPTVAAAAAAIITLGLIYAYKKGYLQKVQKTAFHKLFKTFYTAVFDLQRDNDCPRYPVVAYFYAGVGHFAFFADERACGGGVHDFMGARIYCPGSAGRYRHQGICPAYDTWLPMRQWADTCRNDFTPRRLYLR